LIRRDELNRHDERTLMNFKNTGTIKQVKDGVVFAEGLSDVGYNETVVIKSDTGPVQGLALNLDEDLVGIAVLGDYLKVKEGDLVETQGSLLSISVDEGILGKTVDALGNLYNSSEPACSKGEKLPLERLAPGVLDRENVKTPLQTGILAIDATIPIGRGQRELIIGDRQTGKSTICVDTIINQKGKDVYCIYVSVGQKNAKLAQSISQLEKAGALKYTVIVCANAADPASMQYIAAYAGCAIGEYFAQKGKDALVIYDDLTKHAWAYRELSLLLRRPPGREAYPGDIFYIHSKLLERALQFSKELGSGSLTALPIIETQAGDLSAYIPTNIISITDGQIFLDKDTFNTGQRPAVDIGASVSRVGGDAQVKAMKQIAGKLKLELAQYRELKAFSQFGSDLDEETKKKLDRGARLMETLKQNQGEPLSVEDQILLILAITEGVLDQQDVTKTKELTEKLLSALKKSKELVKLAVSGKRKLAQQEIDEIKKEMSDIIMPSMMAERKHAQSK
jgi:F-type H+/Na+-transporting ATPase subunit alpha